MDISPTAPDGAISPTPERAVAGMNPAPEAGAAGAPEGRARESAPTPDARLSLKWRALAVAAAVLALWAFVAGAAVFGALWGFSVPVLGLLVALQLGALEHFPRWGRPLRRAMERLEPQLLPQRDPSAIPSREGLAGTLLSSLTLSAVVLSFLWSASPGIVAPQFVFSDYAPNPHKTVTPPPRSPANGPGPDTRRANARGTTA